MTIYYLSLFLLININTATFTLTKRLYIFINKYKRVFIRKYILGHKFVKKKHNHIFLKLSKMTAVTSDDYHRLKNEILLNTRNYANNEQQIAVLKHRYENKIGSVRKFGQINTIAQLIEILEKRNCVSENNITILEEIGKDIGNYQFLAEISNLRRNDTEDRNLDPVISRSHILETPSAPLNSVQSPINDNDVKRRVYHAITTEIGNKWIDFARNLKLAESKIDKLKIDTNNNYELCARAVLDFHEHNVHQREWKSRMLQALQKARRDDLRLKVDKIFNDFS